MSATALLVLLALPDAALGAADGPLPTSSDYIVNVWQVEEGLPQISVTSIAQTADGYLWLGTFNGLARFDGVRFTVFNRRNTPALGGNRIVQLALDQTGALWILTEAGGLVRMKNGQFTVHAAEDLGSQSRIGYLAHDSAGRLLFGDRESRLYQIERDQLTLLTKSDPLFAETASGFVMESRGVARIIEEGKASPGLTRPFSVAGEDDSQPVRTELSVQCAVRSSRGGHWLATTTAVYRLQNGRLQPRTSLPDGPMELNCLVEDVQGNLWLGAWGRGIYCWQPSGTWHRFSAGQGMSDPYVTSLFADREGNVWAGTGGGGLHRYKPRVFRMYDSQEGLAGDSVMSMSEDRFGRIWLGVNGGGLNCWEGGRVRPVTEPPRLRRHPLVYSVLADREDGVWIGLYGRGLLRLQGAAVTAYTVEENFLQATPRVLYEDRAGTIWLGSDRGLQRYRNGQFALFTRQDGLSNVDVRALAEDRNGTLYIGTGGGGLNYRRGECFGCYTERDGLADSHIAALWFDGEDTLWIGTVNGGLSRFRQGHFTSVSVRDGLPSNTIGALLEDNGGNLWLSSNRGIARVNRRELNAYMDGQRRHRLAWQYYSRSDGLNSIDCSGGGQPSACKARDGKLWFATAKGAAVVEPGKLPYNSLPPPVVIEEVLLDEKPMAAAHGAPGSMAEGGPVSSLGVVRASPVRVETPGLGAAALVDRATGVLTVPPGHHRLEFHFTALSLVAPEKVRFRYRLRGLEESWADGEDRRTAFYAYIPPGQYRFEVTACNNDGVWNPSGAQVGLLVLPPWWMTWWFRTGCVLAVAGLVFWWTELRLRRLRRERSLQTAFAQRLISSQEEERKRIAAELHDSLGQDLLVIKNRALLGLQAPERREQPREHLEEISHIATQALEDVREISRNLRPYQIDRLGLAKALEAMVSGVSRSSGLVCHVEIESLDGLLVRSSEIHVYRVVQELLNNIIKHSAASQARISLRREGAALVLEVEDDGRGFDLAAVSNRPSHERGVGMTDLAERVRILHGTIQCESKPGEGTRWRVAIPISAPDAL